MICQILLLSIHSQGFILEQKNMMRELLRFDNKVFVNVRHNHYEQTMHGVKYLFSASAISLQKKLKQTLPVFIPGQILSGGHNG